MQTKKKRRTAYTPPEKDILSAKEDILRSEQDLKDVQSFERKCEEIRLQHLRNQECHEGSRIWTSLEDIEPLDLEVPFPLYCGSDVLLSIREAQAQVLIEGKRNIDTDADGLFFAAKSKDRKQMRQEGMERPDFCTKESCERTEGIYYDVRPRDKGPQSLYSFKDFHMEYKDSQIRGVCETLGGSNPAIWEQESEFKTPPESQLRGNPEERKLLVGLFPRALSCPISEPIAGIPLRGIRPNNIYPFGIIPPSPTHSCNIADQQPSNSSYAGSELRRKMKKNNWKEAKNT